MSGMRIVVAGAAGRMGRMLIQTIHATEGAVLGGALERAGSLALGQDAGLLAGVGASDVQITDKPLEALLHADALIDFTTPASTVELAALAAQARIVHVIGTTGLSEDDIAKIDAAARHAVVVRSGNMSLGVNLLAGLVKRVAATLGEDFDIEVLEMHHRMKVDAPSGTAKLLGEAAARGRGIVLSENMESGRHGMTGARSEGAIGFATLRGGTVAGDHSVILAGEQERITLSHLAENRAIFANGAVRGAVWLLGQPAGRYTMGQVLGL